MQHRERVPRFMTPDGSRPMPRKLNVSCEWQPYRKPFKVPGPRRLSMKRLWRPTPDPRQEESQSHSQAKQLEGPNIKLSQLSSDSFPMLSNESGEERNAIAGPQGSLDVFLNQGPIQALIPEEEKKESQVLQEVQTLGGLHLASRQKTTSMPNQRSESMRNDESTQNIYEVKTAKDNSGGTNQNTNQPHLEPVTSILSLVQLLQRTSSFQVGGRSYVFDVNSQELDSLNSRSRSDFTSVLPVVGHSPQLQVGTSPSPSPTSQLRSPPVQRQGTRERLRINVQLAETQRESPNGQLMYDTSDINDRSQLSSNRQSTQPVQPATQDRNQGHPSQLLQPVSMALPRLAENDLLSNHNLASQTQEGLTPVCNPGTGASGPLPKCSVCASHFGCGCQQTNAQQSLNSPNQKQNPEAQPDGSINNNVEESKNRPQLQQANTISFGHGELASAVNELGQRLEQAEESKSPVVQPSMQAPQVAVVSPEAATQPKPKVSARIRRKGPMLNLNFVYNEDRYKETAWIPETGSKILKQQHQEDKPAEQAPSQPAQLFQPANPRVVLAQAATATIAHATAVAIRIDQVTEKQDEQLSEFLDKVGQAEKKNSGTLDGPILQHRESLASINQMRMNTVEIQNLQKDIEKVERTTSTDQRPRHTYSQGLDPSGIDFIKMKTSHHSSFSFQQRPQEVHQDRGEGIFNKTQQFPQNGFAEETKVSDMPRHMKSEGDFEKLLKHHAQELQLNIRPLQPSQPSISKQTAKFGQSPQQAKSETGQFDLSKALDMYSEYDTTKKGVKKPQKANSPDAKNTSAVMSKDGQKKVPPNKPSISQSDSESAISNQLSLLNLLMNNNQMMNQLKSKSSLEIQTPPRLMKSASENRGAFKQKDLQKALDAIQEMQQQAAVSPARAQSDKVDIVFLHASPNIYKDFDASVNKDGFMAPPALNFNREAKTIKGALKESHQQIVYQSKVATKDNFEQTIRQEPKVLHISCHGIRNEVHTMRANFNDVREQGHFLLFENSCGAGELVSAACLRTLMESKSNKIDLIFVAACVSEDIGRIFQRCGVKHVVCVDKKRFVLDEAAIQFTRTFYSLIFKGTPICSAFEAAKQAVRFKLKEHEANLFVMLIQEDMHDEFDFQENSAEEHECCSLPEIEAGEWKCVSDHNLVKQIPSKLEKLKFRDREISTLLEYLLYNNDRIVTVLGLRGVGKSSLARNMLHYVADRKIFRGGILHIQLKDTRSTFGMMKLIMRAILKFLDLEHGEKKKLLDHTCSYDNKIEYFIDFFNNEHGQSFKKKKHRESDRQKPLFLLCLDNAEEIIQNDKTEFTTILSELYDDCPNLRIVVTSIRDIGRLPNEINPKPFILQQLRSSYAAELFLDNCGIIDNEDVFEFLLADKQYPWKKLLPNHKDKEALSQITELTDSLKKEIGYRINIRKNLIDAMAMHDMFRQLSGNPTSVTMMAAIHQNPMIKKEDSNALVDMYQRIKSEKDIVVDELVDEGDGLNAKAIPRVYKNTMSLKISTEMSIKLLEQTYPEDMQILYFLGCLPGGVKESQLKKMWGSKVDLTLKNLESLSFIETGVEKYVLTPYMISYVEGNIDPISKHDFMIVICGYYSELLLQTYKTIGRNQHSNDYEDAVASENASSPSSFNNSEMPKRQSSFNSSFDKKNRPSKALKDFLHEEARKCRDVDFFETKSVFEQLAYELRNIENTLDFLVNYANNHKQMRHSHISFNDSSNIGLSPIKQTEGESECQSPLYDPKLHEHSESEGSAESGPELGQQIQIGSLVSGSLVSNASKTSNRSSISVHGEKSPMSVDLVSKTMPAKMQNSTMTLLLEGASRVTKENDGTSMAKQVIQTLLVSKAQLPHKRRSSYRASVDEIKIPVESEKKKSTLQLPQENLQPILEDTQHEKESTGSERVQTLWSSSDESEEDKLKLEECKKVDFNQQISGDLPINQTLKQSGNSKGKRQSLGNALMAQLHVSKTSPGSASIFQMLQPVEGTPVDQTEVKSEGDQCEESENYYKQGTIESQQLPNRVKLNIGERRLLDEDQSDFDSNSLSESESASSGERNKAACDQIFIDELDSQSQTSKAQSQITGKSKNRVPSMKRVDEPNELETKKVSAAAPTGKQCQTMTHQNNKNIFALMTSQVTKGSDDDYKRRKSFGSSSKKRKQPITIEDLRQDLESALQLDSKINLQRRQNSLMKKRRASQMPKSNQKSIDRKKSVKIEKDEYWKPMSSQGQFIILFVADSFLSQDYEYSMRIASQNFSYIANSSLFEGNILRFRALSSINLFRHALNEDGDIVQNYQLLVQSIDDLRNALRIYEAKDNMKEFSHNSYGMALVNFTLGYIHHQFADELCDERVKHFQEFESYLMVDRNMSFNFASNHYNEAFTQFEECSHFQGMLLSLQSEIETLSCEDYQDEEEMAKKREKAKQIEENLNKYKREVGLENSVYVQRDHGDDISLMTEIVFRQTIEPLFPKKPEELFDDQSHVLGSSFDSGAFFQIKPQAMGKLSGVEEREDEDSLNDRGSGYGSGSSSTKRKKQQAKDLRQKKKLKRKNWQVHGHGIQSHDEHLLTTHFHSKQK